ncbi:MAG: lipopolysaccharide biosynthesis protein [Nitrososphaeraceae archaeon]
MNYENNNWNKIRKIIMSIGGLKGLVTLGMADIIAGGIIAIFWFYMATLLGTEDYGKISYFLAIGSMASTISLIGGNNMLYVYPAKNIKIESPVFFISLVTGCVSSIVLFFIFHDVGTSIYSLGSMIFTLASSEILGKKLYNSYAKYLITQKVLMTTLGIGFFYLSGWEGVIIGIALSFFPHIIRIYRGFKDSKLDFSLIKTRFGFMIHSYFLNFASALSGSIDKIIIAPILGYALLGNYQLGLQFISIFQLFPAIVYKYTLPHDASGNPNIILKKWVILISIISTTLLISLAHLVIPYLFPKYTEVTDVIQIASLSLIPGAIVIIYHSKFLGTEKSKYMIYGAIISIVVQIISIIILGTYYGLEGIAASLVLAGTSDMIFCIIVDQRSKEKKV